MTVDAAVVSASEANRSFSALLRQVVQGRSFTVHSHGRPVAHLTPVSQWGGPLLAARRALRLMRAALDTNLLVYAEGFGDGQRVSAAAWR